MSWNYYGFRPYVPVAQRQRNAQRELAKLAKKGLKPAPIAIEGRTIARSFWGEAWCDNLESYMDFANRLPRGRTYVRNGSVVHLEIGPGKITAMVSGSELYKVAVKIQPAAQAKWTELCRACAGGIGSLVELLQGKFSNHVMEIITRKGTGLFPSPAEIKMDCSCPDWAGMCKHIAAVLYGVGARLDQSPELLFVLRSVNHEDLISQAAAATNLAAKAESSDAELTEIDLGAVFGIELEAESPAVKSTASTAPEALRETRQPTRAPSGTSKASGASRASEARGKKRGKTARRKTLSAEARARISAAQKARWARKR